MAKPTTYLLRSTYKGEAYYLSNVSPNGCRAESQPVADISKCTEDMYWAALEVLQQWHLLDEANCVADQHRGIKAAINAALASKPAAIDAEEVASVLEGALVEDVLPYHSKEWITRAQALLAKLKS